MLTRWSYRRLRASLCGVLLVFAVMLASSSALAEPVTIRFMFRGGALQEQLVGYWIEQFERDNPDIRIEWHVASGSGFQAELPLLIATGTGPDVFETWGGDFKRLADGGFLFALDDLVARDFTDEEIKDFFPISWDSGVMVTGPYTGSRFGLPSPPNVFVLYYNKDMFLTAGIPSPTELDRQGAWTWDDFVDVGKKLTRRVDDQVVQWALHDDSLMFPIGRGLGFLHAAGGKIFDIPDNPTRFMLDQPEALYALQYMQDLIWKHGIQPPMDIRGQADFYSGKSAMALWIGTAGLETLKSRAGDTFAWDMGPRPMGPASRGYYVSPDMFAMSANTPHPEEAWRFLRYLVSRDGLEAYMRIMGRGPVTRSSFEEYMSWHPGISTQYAMEGLMDGVVSPGLFIPNVDEASGIITATWRNNIATNKMSPEQAIAEIADAVRALYE